MERSYQAFGELTFVCRLVLIGKWIYFAIKNNSTGISGTCLCCSLRFRGAVVQVAKQV